MQDEELQLYSAALQVTGRKPPSSSSSSSLSSSQSSINNTEQQQAAADNMPQITINPNPSISAPLSATTTATTILYRPDKIISRFLRKRLLLLENALFIEYQLHDKDSFKKFLSSSALKIKLDNNNNNNMDDSTTLDEIHLDEEMKEQNEDSSDGTEPETLDDSDKIQNQNGEKLNDDHSTTNDDDDSSTLQSKANNNNNNNMDIDQDNSDTEQDKMDISESKSNEKENQEQKDVDTMVDEKNEDEKENSSLEFETIHTLLEKNYLNITPDKIDDLKANLDGHQITDGLAIALALEENEKSANPDISSRLEFLGAFAKMYNSAHHLLDQLEEYHKTLKHNDVQEEAVQEHYNGLFFFS